jgi:hypothetical protein
LHRLQSYGIRPSRPGTRIKNKARRFSARSRAQRTPARLCFLGINIVASKDSSLKMARMTRMTLLAVCSGFPARSRTQRVSALLRRARPYRCLVRQFSFLPCYALLFFFTVLQKNSPLIAARPSSPGALRAASPSINLESRMK